MNGNQTKQKLRQDLDLIVRTLAIEEKPVEEIMNFVGSNNADVYWRFTNADEVKQLLINKINELL